MKVYSKFLNNERKHLLVINMKVKVAQLYPTLGDPNQDTGVGSCSLLQVIFPTQGLNPGLLHCRQTLYQLSYEGSPSTAINK